MSDLVISGIRVEPGFTNSEKITRTTEEDKVIGEGAIYYDIRSIWICMDSADDEDSINRIRLTQENLYGKEPNRKVRKYE
ncbi:MAG: hypothetical protein SOZ81_06315 [Agathobacter sp.]|nr:hypothetical protein [Agathobacter sp.]